MAIELWVHGPRYGESILLIWHEAGAHSDETLCKAALIDCHGTYAPIEKPLSTVPAVLVPLLKRQEPWTLSFVAGTHPHLDHVACLAQVVAKLGEEERVEKTLWWGGHFSDALKFHRLRAAYHKGTGEIDRARASKAAFEYLLIAKRLEAHQNKPMVSHSGITKFYQRNLPGGGTIRIWGISPCASEREAFHDAMRQQDHAAKRLAPVHSNRTSLGFLIQYNEAQILLGGDMEEANWRHFNNVRFERHGDEHDLPQLSPNVIKVSHHGSSTGCIPGMWEPGNGFFETALGGALKPVCIVTPWNTKLPDKEVIEQIRRAGCRVLVTGRGKKPPMEAASLLDQETRKAGSYCHLKVHKNGVVEDVELFGCLDHPPLDLADILE